MNIIAIDIVQQFQFEALLKLKENTGCEYVYAITGIENSFYGNRKVINNIYSQIFKNQVDTISNLIFPNEIQKLKEYPWKIDQHIIEECRDIESLFMKMTDRSASTPISVQSRGHIYLTLLNYFYNLLNETEASHLICFDTPHTFPSIILYELCKKRNIKIIRMEYHHLPEYSILVDKNIPEQVPHNFLSGHSTAQLKNMFLLKNQSNKKIENKYFQSYMSSQAKIISGHGLISKVQLAFRLIAKKITNIIQGVLPFLFKPIFLHFNSLNNLKTNFSYRLSINKALNRIISQNLYYNSLAIKSNLNSNYIFLGLHMQPEKTSLPLGGEYVNQLLIVKMISECLPANWKLLVKEHPNQFNVRKSTNANFRSKFFYDSINKKSNVELVDLQVSSKELIANSKMVATITGTLGIEALTNNKAVLCFGEAYYQCCDAVRSIKSLNDLPAAISELNQMPANKIEHSYFRYLNYLKHEGILIKCGSSETKIKLSSNSREFQIVELSKALRKALMA